MSKSISKDYLTDEQVEQEIERLEESDAVALARKEQAYKYRRRQRMYSLRWLEKRGKELMKLGMTLESFDFEELDDNEISKLYAKLKTKFNLQEDKA